MESALAAVLAAVAVAGAPRAAGASAPEPAPATAPDAETPAPRPPAPVAELQKALRKHLKDKAGRGRPYRLEDLEAEVRWSLRFRRFAKEPPRRLRGERYVVRVEFFQEPDVEEGLTAAAVAVDFTLQRGGGGWKILEEAVFSVDGEKRFDYDEEGRRLPAD